MAKHHLKQPQPLEIRLAKVAERLHEEAKLLPPGTMRDELLRKARQAETGVRMIGWLSSPGLRPPT